MLGSGGHHISASYQREYRLEGGGASRGLVNISEFEMSIIPDSYESVVFSGRGKKRKSALLSDNSQQRSQTQSSYAKHWSIKCALGMQRKLQKVRLSILISGGVFPLQCRQMDWCSLHPFSNKVAACGSRAGQSRRLHLITDDRRSCGQGRVALHTSPVNITSEPPDVHASRGKMVLRHEHGHQSHTPAHNLVSGEPGLRGEQVLDPDAFVTFHLVLLLIWFKNMCHSFPNFWFK